MPANSRWDSAFKVLKLLKNPGNGRLNNLNDPVLNVLISLIFLDFWEHLAWFSISYRTQKNYLYTSFILGPVIMGSVVIFSTTKRVFFIACCTWAHACTCSAGNQQKPCEQL